jgi:hypothetical protein
VPLAADPFGGNPPSGTTIPHALKIHAMKSQSHRDCAEGIGPQVIQTTNLTQPKNAFPPRPAAFDIEPQEEICPTTKPFNTLGGSEHEP